MNIKIGLTGLAAVVAVLTLSACGNNSSAAPEAPKVETPEEAVARISASMSPQDFKLREINCLENISFAKRMGEYLPADLNTDLQAEPRMDFLALTRQARELGVTSEQVGNAQRDQPAVPKSSADITPEFIANTKECLLISKVANKRDGVS